jgi:hypothetical protein
MPKEVEKKLCETCDSEYKIVFDLNNTSGFPKFCCFCGEAMEERDEDDYEEDPDE